jgi:hypothetical protein
MNPDVSVPNAARIYDFFLGGKDNYAADRELAQKILAILPDTADVCRANRAFLQRSVQFLAAQADIRQFLDIGAGLPTMGNVHEVAQEPDEVPDDVTEAMKDVYSGASAQVAPRSSEDIARFFDGLELTDPGLVNVTLWRPDRPSHTPRRSLIYGGVALKP